MHVFPLNISIFVSLLNAYCDLTTHNLIFDSLSIEKYLL